MLWDENRRQLMVIDFERARAAQPRCVLGVITANQSNTTRSSTDTAKAANNGCIFGREGRHAANALRQLR